MQATFARKAIASCPRGWCRCSLRGGRAGGGGRDASGVTSLGRRYTRGELGEQGAQLGQAAHLETIHRE